MVFWKVNTFVLMAWAPDDFLLCLGCCYWIPRPRAVFLAFHSVFCLRFSNFSFPSSLSSRCVLCFGCCFLMLFDSFVGAWFFFCLFVSLFFSYVSVWIFQWKMKAFLVLLIVLLALPAFAGKRRMLTKNDVCKDKVCPLPNNQCYDKAECKKLGDQGVCVYTPSAAGTPCDDGDDATCGDQCDGDGNCKGKGLYSFALPLPLSRFFSGSCSSPLFCCLFLLCCLWFFVWWCAAGCGELPTPENAYEPKCAGKDVGIHLNQFQVKCDNDTGNCTEHLEGTKCGFHCLPGFTPTRDDLYVLCQGDGTWLISGGCIRESCNASWCGNFTRVCIASPFCSLNHAFLPCFLFFLFILLYFLCFRTASLSFCCVHCYSLSCSAMLATQLITRRIATVLRLSKAIPSVVFPKVIARRAANQRRIATMAMRASSIPAALKTEACASLLALCLPTQTTTEWIWKQLLPNGMDTIRGLASHQLSNSICCLINAHSFRTL